MSAIKTVIKKKPIFRTLVTIYPEIPARPFFTLERSTDKGKTWGMDFATNDHETYTAMTKEQVIQEVQTIQELPL